MTRKLHTAVVATLSAALLALIAPSPVLAGRFCATADPTLCVQAQDAGNGVARITITWPRASFGWVAFGISPQNQMPGTDIFAVWPSGSSFIVSDRMASARVLPPPDASQDLTIGPGSSAMAGNYTIEILRNFVTGDASDHPLVTGTQSYAIAYNLGTSPGTSASSTLTVHDNAEIHTANLIDFTPSSASAPAASSTASAGASATVTPSTGAGTPSTGSGAGSTTTGNTNTGTGSSAGSAAQSPESQDPFNAYLKAHGVLMFIAWAFVAPTSAALAFYARGKPYFQLHWYMMYLAAALCLISFALVVYWQQMSSGSSAHFVTTRHHTITGLVIVILTVVQVVLGFVNHAIGYEGARPIRNWIHIYLGRGLFLLAICNVAIGLNTYLFFYSLSRILLWIYVAGVCAYVVALYGAGWAVLGGHRAEWHETRFGNGTVEEEEAK
ncbi:hypothetical protein M427DRAFT_29497 [Gonapodya prolifera JEL478]|uniref:Cytochrome b561 domain-containing protein n=1 Tax=Gonapodya prolifera (strain JEL478) TaxID=1344416 RepID=A0A139AQ01_GONPJ|nr:hypothetical protein M427DRAFT_29497 [Gonapodya prolifera JEL478]|eukprot:KXS18565.1 hypothetical protein M427DRAFT_29497 [Gonapodya prolifera JEL478]